jgi:hypothetical protein
MATGRLPFAGASPAETVTNILENDPTPLKILSSDRPGHLDQIVKKLVAKHADDRYNLATAFGGDITSGGTVVSPLSNAQST